ncbi:MAG: hypothetical protein REJ50_14135 [Bordetella sp.]|nr:hypothetical protein [Bordetella sp.]
MNAAVLNFPAQGADTGADRRAALLLHAMDAADRVWVLEALPAHAQAVLRPLVAELEALGLERDPALVEQALRAAEPPDHGAAMGAVPPVAGPGAPGILLPDEQFLMTLDAGQVRLLVAALGKEPPELIRLVLTTRAWPWHAALMQSLAESTRLRVQEGLGNSIELGDTALDRPALRATVLRVLARTVRRGEAGPAPGRVAWLGMKRRAGDMARVFRRSSS